MNDSMNFALDSNSRLSVADFIKMMMGSCVQEVWIVHPDHSGRNFSLEEKEALGEYLNQQLQRKKIISMSLYDPKRNVTTYNVLILYLADPWLGREF